MENKTQIENPADGVLTERTDKKSTDKKKKKKIIIIIAISVAAVAVGLLLFFLLRPTNAFRGTPTLSLQTPEKRTVGDASPFTVELRLSSLGDDIYPAASFSIGFDKSRLEFLGIEEGNVTVSDNANGEKMPQWSVNVEKSNEIGTINIMYLDITGGKNAFSQSLLADKGNVVLRLSFRLRGSARRSDVYETEIKDAVFASSEEKNSLSSANGTLKTKNGKIVVGE